jgi:hypothetical protein
MVPAVVIVPPVKPVPAVTEVTDPEPEALTVIIPVLALRVTPTPAIKLVTPVLLTTTLPTFGDTAMPVPPVTLVTPPPPPPEDVITAVL